MGSRRLGSPIQQCRDRGRTREPPINQVDTALQDRSPFGRAPPLPRRRHRRGCVGRAQEAPPESIGRLFDAHEVQAGGPPRYSQQIRERGLSRHRRSGSRRRTRPPPSSWGSDAQLGAWGWSSSRTRKPRRALGVERGWAELSRILQGKRARVRAVIGG